MAPPAIKSFVSTAEQRHFDEDVLPLRPTNSLPSVERNRFMSMSGRKRSSSHLDDGDEDDGEDDDDDDNDGGDKDADSEANDDNETASARVKGKDRPKNPKKRNATSTGRRKISIQYIEDKAKRNVSFTKRKSGLIKKAFELSTLTGTECLILVVSESGLVYTYATPSLKPIVDNDQGREFIMSSLRGELAVPTTSGAAISSTSRPSEGSPTTFGFGNDLYPIISKADGHGPTLQSADVPTDPLASSAGRSSRPSDVEPPVGHNGSTQPSISNATASPIVLDPSLPMYSLTSYSPPFPSSVSYNGEPNTSYAAYAVSSAAPSAASHRQVPLASSPYYPVLSTTSLQASETVLGVPSAGSVSSGSSAVANSLTLEDATRAHHQAFAMYDLQNQLKMRQASPVAEHENGIRVWKRSAEARGPVATYSDEKRQKLKQEAARALAKAKEEPTISEFLSAHALHVKAQLPCSSSAEESANARPKEGILLTMDLFEKLCSTLGLNDPAQLQDATEVFLNRILPSISYTPKNLQEARSHLTLFFDFLEGHDLISSSQHASLTSFDFSPSAPLPKGVDVKAALQRWVAKAQAQYLDRTRACSVEGVFEIYRVRKTYVILHGKDLKGDATLNACLDPFKVRMPRNLTPLLGIGDMLFITVVQVVDKSYWIPTCVLAYDPCTSPDLEESDIDPAGYAAEVARLEALPSTQQNANDIKLAKETCEMLVKVKEAIAEGEISEGDDG